MDNENQNISKMCQEEHMEKRNPVHEKFCKLKTLLCSEQGKKNQKCEKFKELFPFSPSSTQFFIFFLICLGLYYPRYLFA